MHCGHAGQCDAGYRREHKRYGRLGAARFAARQSRTAILDDRMRSAFRIDSVLTLVVIGHAHAAIDRIAGDRGHRLAMIATLTVRGVVIGILGTALTQRVLIRIGSWMAGIKVAPLLGLEEFFLSTVPLVCNAPAWRFNPNRCAPQPWQRKSSLDRSPLRHLRAPDGSDGVRCRARAPRDRVPARRPSAQKS